MATMDLSRENANQTIQRKGIVLIDFWAAWCGPCRMFGPTYEKGSELHPEVTFAKCNTDEQTELASEFNIRSIPTLAVFRDGVLVFMRAGSLTPKSLNELIEQVNQLDMEEVRATISQERQAKAV